MTSEAQKVSTKKSLGSYCAAINCHNARKNCNLSMFCFPRDEERCRKWVQNTRHEDLRGVTTRKLYNYQLCSKHFEESQFMNKETQNKLVWNAIPTLFDVPNPPSKVTPSCQVKVRSVSSAVKKAPAKEPIVILQDLHQLLSKPMSVILHRKKD